MYSVYHNMQYCYHVQLVPAILYAAYIVASFPVSVHGLGMRSPTMVLLHKVWFHSQLGSPYTFTDRS